MKYFELLREIPGEVFLVADDIAANAWDELDCSLSPNTTYALADHELCAHSALRDGIALQTPLAYDPAPVPAGIQPCKAGPAPSSGICTLSCTTGSCRHCNALHHGGIRGRRHALHHLTAKVVSEISALVEKNLGEARAASAFPACHASAVPRTSG